jgi:signal transduction histidine kinase
MDSPSSSLRDFSADIDTVRSFDAIPKILEVVCQTTGLGYAAVARVTEDRWMVCAALDKIGFGLGPGGELPIGTTLCREVREACETVVIDHVDEDEIYRTHPTPALYGFQSYISVPIVLPGGEFFGTLCAIGPRPAQLRSSAAQNTLQLFADLIAMHLRDTRLMRDIHAEKAAIESFLRQSQKMEAVGQLTAGLAHDFNNVLVGVSGSFEMMERRLSQGRAAELGGYIASGQQATRRAAALAGRLMAFSRHHEIAPTVVDAGKVAQGMLDLVSRTAGSGIAVTVAVEPELWLILVDENQLEVALLNLCINARDAMADGGTLRIVIANHHDDGDTSSSSIVHGDHVVVSVADGGIGMSPEVAARVLEPFFTTKPPGYGTGLGLPMVNEFVRAAEGRLQLVSRPGEGTTVSLYLPRARPVV